MKKRERIQQQGKAKALTGNIRQGQFLFVVLLFWGPVKFNDVGNLAIQNGTERVKGLG